MKKLLMAMIVAACALGAQAEGNWQDTLAKVKNLAGYACDDHTLTDKEIIEMENRIKFELTKQLKAELRG